MSYFFINLCIGREEVANADLWGPNVSLGIKMRKDFGPPGIKPGTYGSMAWLASHCAKLVFLNNEGALPR
jgi:hypothetical protein